MKTGASQVEGSERGRPEVPDSQEREKRNPGGGGFDFPSSSFDNQPP